MGACATKPETEDGATKKQARAAEKQSRQEKEAAFEGEKIGLRVKSLNGFAEEV
uniref:Uncharacterized protein n=1 Tax=uncultured SAR11 cluster alpha proteobacterium H17925_45G17 TaxID=715038 RepID=E7CA54_9PROT|nr:hypothetical protein [uncultured SAR11 cluster alpha proteobacterium H17925_45G17]